MAARSHILLAQNINHDVENVRASHKHKRCQNAIICLTQCFTFAYKCRTTLVLAACLLASSDSIVLYILAPNVTLLTDKTWVSIMLILLVLVRFALHKQASKLRTTSQMNKYYLLLFMTFNVFYAEIALFIILWFKLNFRLAHTYFPNIHRVGALSFGASCKNPERSVRCDWPKQWLRETKEFLLDLFISSILSSFRRRLVRRDIVTVYMCNNSR